LKILLVEDNPVNTQLATRLLEKLGHCVVHVENGLEAINKAEDNYFDMILMDVQMPEMGGFDATKIIRNRGLEAKEPCSFIAGKYIPIIAMTAHALQGDREKCLEAGMDDYIPKPIHIETLRTTIERWALFKENQPTNHQIETQPTNHQIETQPTNHQIENQPTSQPPSYPNVCVSSITM